MKMPVRMDAGLLSTASTGFKQDIDTFLAKPYPIYTGAFSTTDTSGTFPVNQVLTTLCALDIYKQKIKGHLGLRCTVELRIQFNAERFMQGRYILAFMPMVTNTSLTGYQHSDSKSLQCRFNKTTVTQLPHVEFDLNTDTEAVLEIPYVSPYSHFRPKDGQGDVGSYFIYPYSPLVTGSTGSTTCQFTMWASMKDVELVAPTVAQMAKSGKGMRPVATVRKRGTVSEGEQIAGDIGPIESVLNKVTKAADVMAKIPVISMVASQVSWATAIAASAAHAFGWSKPLSIEAARRMYPSFFPFWGNCDTADMGLPMSYLSTNAIEALPGFAGTDIDETGIDYLKTIPAYISQFQWTTGQTAQDVLYLIDLFPTNFINTYSDAYGNINTMTPLSWLGSAFQYYKGSIRLTFKIVKTEFHSGRLMLMYDPGRSHSQGAMSIVDSTYLHREILDVRLGNEFSFVIPYVSTSTYKANNDSYGVVQINVLNDLVAPASVSGAVTVLVEVSAAPDMEFAFPLKPTQVPAVPISIQSGLRFQMDMGQGDGIIDEGVLSNAAMFDDKLSGARFCIGEKICSVSQLIKTPVSSYTMISGAGSQIQIFPYAAETLLLTPPQLQPDWYDYFISAYAMSRGGIRLKLIAENLNGQIVNAKFFPQNVSSTPNKRYSIGDPSTYFAFSANSFNTAPSQFFKYGTSPVEVSIAQYHRLHSRVNCELMTGTGLGTSYNTSAPTSSAPNTFVNFSLNGGVEFDSSALTVFRSVSDDFQLGYFIGVPPMRTTAT